MHGFGNSRRRRRVRMTAPAQPGSGQLHFGQPAASGLLALIQEF